jgi:hypothetical protein
MIALRLICANSLAQAFTKLVNSLVSDIILPPMSLLPFINRNLEEKFVVLRKGPSYPYNTRVQAMEDGAVIMPIGRVQVINSSCRPLTVLTEALFLPYSTSSQSDLLYMASRCFMDISQRTRSSSLAPRQNVRIAESQFLKRLRGACIAVVGLMDGRRKRLRRRLKRTFCRHPSRSNWIKKKRNDIFKKLYANRRSEGGSSSRATTQLQ